MRYLTAGESHGKGLVAILDGVPANLKINQDEINHQLFRRQQGYGRGGRMKIESDKIEILSGVRGGVTTGSPIALFIANKDYEVWKNIIGASAENLNERTLTKVRPGHVDLAGAIKYNQADARNILERSSARETAIKTAVGAIARQLLNELDILVGSHVVSIGKAVSSYVPKSALDLIENSDNSCVRCMDKTAEKQMIKQIDFCIQNGDTAGGEIELIASGMPVGVGSFAQFDKRLDYMISGHLGALQAVKSVGIGAAYQSGSILGSELHDEIENKNGKIIRETNRAGGIEGGVTNGENIIVKATVKPIPTLMKPLKTIDLLSKENCLAEAERSDYCAVPAAGVVLENMLCFTLADALLETLGGDHIDEVKERFILKKQRGEQW